MCKGIRPWRSCCPAAPSTWRRAGRTVPCFGAGGSTTAIALHLAQKRDRADRPRRVTVVNRSAGRLDCLRKMVAGLDTDIEFEYHCNVLPEVNDELMGKLPPASLVINATGMGKDLPGSPITDGGLFPIGGVAWELNYRGDLRFLHQALAQCRGKVEMSYFGAMRRFGPNARGACHSLQRHCLASRPAVKASLRRKGRRP